MNVVTNCNDTRQLAVRENQGGQVQEALITCTCKTLQIILFVMMLSHSLQFESSCDCILITSVIEDISWSHWTGASIVYGLGPNSLKFLAILWTSSCVIFYSLFFLLVSCCCRLNFSMCSEFYFCRRFGFAAIIIATGMYHVVLPPVPSVECS